MRCDIQKPEDESDPSADMQIGRTTVVLQL
jgi:hypothetical protein